jgi:hypothetical protein
VTWLELFDFNAAAPALSSNSKADVLSTSFEDVDITGAQGEAGATTGMVTGEGLKHSSILVDQDCNVPNELIEEGLAIPSKWLPFLC